MANQKSLSVTRMAKSAKLTCVLLNYLAPFPKQPFVSQNNIAIVKICIDQSNPINWAYDLYPYVEWWAAELVRLLWHTRNTAEPSMITPEEYHNIFGSSDEENSDVDTEGSDIDVPEIDSDEEVEDVEESDNEDNPADAIGELADFVISQFNGQPGIKVEVSEEPRSDFFFNLILGDEMIDLIVRETNRYAWQKLGTNIAQLNKWQDTTRQEVKASLGICLIMAINNLPRLAMYWSSDPFIGNKGIQNIVSNNRFKDFSQYLHFFEFGNRAAV